MKIDTKAIEAIQRESRRIVHPDEEDDRLFNIDTLTKQMLSVTSTKKQSRPQRWRDAVARAQEAIGDLVGLRDEYQEWLDNLPENLQSGNLAEKLQAICDLDLDGAQSTIEECESAELPLGFGRD